MRSRTREELVELCYCILDDSRDGALSTSQRAEKLAGLLVELTGNHGVIQEPVKLDVHNRMGVLRLHAAGLVAQPDADGSIRLTKDGLLKLLDTLSSWPIRAV